MSFPFLTSEVKCGMAGIGIADRQNAHSMTLAVRGLVEFFRLAKQEHELNREVITFSIFHDHQMVRIYGHYPEIHGSKTKIYHHLIHAFDITSLDGKERWTAYKFTVAVYKHSSHLLERIHSVLNSLDLDMDILEIPRTEQIASNDMPPPLSTNQIPRAVEQAIGEASLGEMQPITPDTST